jgi:hypothetical protein
MPEGVVSERPYESVKGKKRPRQSLGSNFFHLNATQNVLKKIYMMHGSILWKSFFDREVSK